ncbi:MAG: cyclase/dehydrase [Gemmatimonadetes bacterium]|jgi:uncharacterized membrane protein|nr:cyclase/dehydrase [Gemmatimonadota bacterium]
MALAGTAPRIASRSTSHSPSAQQNVANPERIGSVVLGAALVAFGLRRRGAGGIVAALAGGALLHRGATGHCHLYEALGVSTGASEAVLDRSSRGITGLAATVNARRAIKVEHAVTIDAPRATLYAFWRDFRNLPRFMDHLVSVTVGANGRSHWVAKAPAGQTAEWDAELVNDVPDAIIAWKSVGHPDVANAGAVNFSDAPGGGTVVRVTLDYEPPGGRVGAMIARFFGENPDQQVADDLQKFKRLMEGA